MHLSPSTPRRSFEVGCRDLDARVRLRGLEFGAQDTGLRVQEFARAHNPLAVAIAGDAKSLARGVDATTRYRPSCDGGIEFQLSRFDLQPDPGFEILKLCAQCIRLSFGLRGRGVRLSAVEHLPIDA